ncbi:hypothetical protein CDAR_125031, partial [Caerostris darwini]
KAEKALLVLILLWVSPTIVVIVTPAHRTAGSSSLTPRPFCSRR